VPSFGVRFGVDFFAAALFFSSITLRIFFGNQEGVLTVDAFFVTDLGILAFAFVVILDNHERVDLPLGLDATFLAAASDSFLIRCNVFLKENPNSP
tara:strand:- start:1341 stop:1628 length:288 start_codon:yes stop_codon:yes gene_type:complete